MDENTSLRTYKTEYRISTSADGRTMIRGLVCPYGSLSLDLGGHRERFLPGAFSASLNADVLADVEHDRMRKIGRTKSGSLRLYETPAGLYCEITVPDTAVGRDAAEEVRAGLLDAMSVCFRDAVATWSGSGRNTIREVKSARLTGIALTASPAYTQTAGTLTVSAGTAPRSVGWTPVEVMRRRLDVEEAIEENDAAIRRSRETPVAFRRTQLQQAMAENWG
jgi:HK97 family phage prohead protease